MDINHTINSVKLAWTSAVTTLGVGLGTIMEFIPDDIGKLASVFGIVLTTILIVNHWRMAPLNRENKRLETENKRLENEKLMRELEDG